MLAARSGAILFRTDVCKAVIYFDKAVLFPARCAGHSRGGAGAGNGCRQALRGVPACLPAPAAARRRLSDTVRISQSIKAAITQASPLPFELKVLEALLSGAAGMGGGAGAEPPAREDVSGRQTAAALSTAQY